MKRNYQLWSLLLCCWMAACENDPKEVGPEQRFIRVYQHSDFQMSFYPMDLREMPEGGFMVLSRVEIGESTLGGIHLLRTDPTGQLLWENTQSGNFTNPLPGMMTRPDGVFFFCMDPFNTTAYLVKADDASQQALLARSYPDLTFPLASSQTPDGGALMLGYDRERQETTLTRINSGLSVVWQQGYEIQEDVDGLIFSHLADVNKRLPFFTGTLQGGGVFFNGFNNFTLSVTFVNAQDGEQTGILNGYRADGAISALHHVQGDRFLLTHFAFGRNYVVPQASLNTSGIANIADFSISEFPEIAANNSYSRVQLVEVGGKRIAVLAANARNNQVVLYGFDLETGDLLGRVFLGYYESFQLGAVQPTRDGGLVVLGNVFLAGRFPRIALYKLAPADLLELAGQ